MGIDGITNYWMKLDCMPSSRGTECRNPFWLRHFDVQKWCLDSYGMG